MANKNNLTAPPSVAIRQRFPGVDAPSGNS